MSTVIDATFAVVKRKPGKIQAFMDFHIKLFIKFCLLLCFKGNIWAKFIRYKKEGGVDGLLERRVNIF